MASIADLRPGWHQLDADILIDEAGNATLCEPLPDDEPIAGLGTSRCPADAPAVAPIDIGELDARRRIPPLVVPVNDYGTIDPVPHPTAGGHSPHHTKVTA